MKQVLVIECKIKATEIVDVILAKKMPYGMKVEEIGGEFAVAKSFPYPSSKMEDCERFRQECESSLGINCEIKKQTMLSNDVRAAWGDN